MWGAAFDNRCRRGAAPQERAVVGRITRQPSKPKFVHEVQVSRAEVDQPWRAELLARTAGPNGYRKRTPFWAYTVFSFVRWSRLTRCGPISGGIARLRPGSRRRSGLARPP